MFSEDIDHKFVKIVFPHQSHFPQKSLICHLEYQTLKMLKYFLFEFVDFHNNSNIKKVKVIFCRLKNVIFARKLHHTQLTFTCSKSTIVTLEKGVKYVQS